MGAAEGRAMEAHRVLESGETPKASKAVQGNTCGVPVVCQNPHLVCTMPCVQVHTRCVSVSRRMQARVCNEIRARTSDETRRAG